MTPGRSARAVIAVGVVVALAAAAWRWHDAPFARPAFWLEAVDSNPTGAPVIFAAAYALAVVLLLPTLPLNLVAGVLWGPTVGSVVAVCGSATGAIASFLIARAATVASGIAPALGGRTAWLESRLAEHGWKIVAFVRLNPIFPGPVNFLFGLTSIPVRTYCWATALFIVPPTTAFAILGSSVGSAALEGRVEHLGRMLPLAGASVLLLVVSAIVLRRYTAQSEPLS